MPRAITSGEASCRVCCGKFGLPPRPPRPPRDLVILDYALEAEPILEPFAKAPRDWSGSTDVNFDEFDLIEDGERLLYTESIVFGNGWVMHLCFRDVRVTLADPLFASPGLAAVARSA